MPQVLQQFYRVAGNRKLLLNELIFSQQSFFYPVPFAIPVTIRKVQTKFHEPVRICQTMYSKMLYLVTNLATYVVSNFFYQRYNTKQLIIIFVQQMFFLVINLSLTVVFLKLFFLERGCSPDFCDYLHYHKLRFF